MSEFTQEFEPHTFLPEERILANGDPVPASLEEQLLAMRAIAEEATARLSRAGQDSRDLQDRMQRIPTGRHEQGTIPKIPDASNTLQAPGVPLEQLIDELDRIFKVLDPQLGNTGDQTRPLGIGEDPSPHHPALTAPPASGNPPVNNQEQATLTWETSSFASHQPAPGTSRVAAWAGPVWVISGGLVVGALIALAWPSALHAPGTVVAREQLDLRAPVGGRVSSLIGPIRPGLRIEPGVPFLQVANPSDLDAVAGLERMLEIREASVFSMVGQAKALGNALGAAMRSHLSILRDQLERAGAEYQRAKDAVQVAEQQVSQLAAELEAKRTSASVDAELSRLAAHFEVAYQKLDGSQFNFDIPWAEGMGQVRAIRTWQIIGVSEVTAAEAALESSCTNLRMATSSEVAARATRDEAERRVIAIAGEVASCDMMVGKAKALGEALGAAFRRQQSILQDQLEQADAEHQRAKDAVQAAEQQVSQSSSDLAWAEELGKIRAIRTRQILGASEVTAAEAALEGSRANLRMAASSTVATRATRDEAERRVIVVAGAVAVCATLAWPSGFAEADLDVTVGGLRQLMGIAHDGDDQIAALQIQALTLAKDLSAAKDMLAQARSELSAGKARLAQGTISVQNPMVVVSTTPGIGGTVEPGSLLCTCSTPTEHRFEAQIAMADLPIVKSYVDQASIRLADGSMLSTIPGSLVLNPEMRDVKVGLDLHRYVFLQVDIAGPSPAMGLTGELLLGLSQEPLTTRMARNFRALF